MESQLPLFLNHHTVKEVSGMRNFIVILSITLLAATLSAQETRDAGKLPPSSMFGLDLFAERVDPDNNTDNRFMTYGFLWRWGDLYTKQVLWRSGWHVSLGLGYGSGQGKTHIPLIFDLGIDAGTSALKLADVSIAYSFLGRYHYANYGFVGSHVGLKGRWNLIEGEVTRQGDGFITGCFSPRFGSAAVHTYGVRAFVWGEFYVGFRLANVPSNGNAGRSTSEMRFSIGVAD
jgi:hypothetical protein